MASICTIQAWPKSEGSKGQMTGVRQLGPRRIPVADSGGDPGGPGPPSPHFWGTRLYSEAQIAPFYTQITEKFSKKFCLASLGILFQFSIDIFWSKTLKIIQFWGPRLYSEAQIAPFYTQISEKFSKKICLASLDILFKFSYWHILIKNIRKLFIFEAPDYLLSHKLHLFTLK